MAAALCPPLFGPSHAAVNLCSLWLCAGGNCCDGEGCGFTKREDHVQALDSQGRLLVFSGSQQNPRRP